MPVREYATPSAFRAAVEARLRDRARSLDVAAYVLRRQAALARLMARLSRIAPGRWAVKGGFALGTRLGDRARVSVDLDADHVDGATAARVELHRLQLVGRHADVDGDLQPQELRNSTRLLIWSDESCPHKRRIRHICSPTI